MGFVSQDLGDRPNRRERRPELVLQLLEPIRLEAPIDRRLGRLPSAAAA
jgi:hypothetical protein